MPTQDINGTEIHYERRGNGPPLLLLMGMAGNHLHWGEPFLALLERDFELLTFDHRGTGHSGWDGQPFTIPELADDAAALLAALDIDSAHVLGISMGGMVAQELTIGHPERVRTLYLGCTYCGGEDALRTEQAVVERLTEATLSGDRERAIRAGWEANVSPGMAGDPATYESFRELTRRLPTSVSVLMAQMGAVGGHDTSTRLGQIGVPALVVHGTEDQMLPVANAKLIADRISDAELVILDGVGHLFFWERPERAAQLARELAERAAQPAARPAQ